jgi:hypothetical protein
MATKKKCLCGCGGDVNPGRSFIQGHNQKHGAPAKYQSVIASKSVLKVKHRRRKMGRHNDPPPLSAVLAIVRARQEKISKLIELLQEVL